MVAKRFCVDRVKVWSRRDGKRPIERHTFWLKMVECLKRVHFCSRMVAQRFRVDLQRLLHSWEAPRTNWDHWKIVISKKKIHNLSFIWNFPQNFVISAIFPTKFSTPVPSSSKFSQIYSKKKSGKNPAKTPDQLHHENPPHCSYTVNTKKIGKNCTSIGVNFQSQNYSRKIAQFSWNFLEIDQQWSTIKWDPKKSLKSSENPRKIRFFRKSEKKKKK